MVAKATALDEGHKETHEHEMERVKSDNRTTHETGRMKQKRRLERRLTSSRQRARGCRQALTEVWGKKPNKEVSRILHQIPINYLKLTKLKIHFP